MDLTWLGYLTTKTSPAAGSLQMITLLVQKIRSLYFQSIMPLEDVAASGDVGLRS